MVDNNDKNTSISFFKNQVDDFVEKRGWRKYHTPKNLAQALNCEAGELSQLLLFKEFKIEEIVKDESLLNDIADESADVFIYLISFINSLGLDLTETFLKKMDKNKKKYPISEFNNGIYFKK